MEKMVKTAGRLERLVKILFWICLAAAIVMFAVPVLLLFIPDDFLLNNIFRIAESAWTQFVPIGSEVYADIMRQSSLLQLLPGAIVLLFSCICLHFIRNILAPMAQGRPFADTVPKNLSRLSWIALGTGAVIEIGRFIVEATYFSNHAWESLLSSNFTDHRIYFEYWPNLLFILLFVFLRLISYVFRYGQQLQQLEDETL